MSVKQLEMMQKIGFLGMLLGTLGASLLGNMLNGKNERKQIEPDRIFNEALSFIYFWNQRYYQNKSKFDVVFSKNKLPKLKDEYM